MPLPQLPSYIELRSPSPEFASRPPINMYNTEVYQESTLQRPEKPPIATRPRSSLITSDRHINELPSDDAEHSVEIAGNAFLSFLPLSEIADCLRESRWETYLGMSMDTQSTPRSRLDSSQPTGMIHLRAFPKGFTKTGAQGVV